MKFVLIPDSFKGTLSSSKICSILKEEDSNVRSFRLALSKLTAKVIKTGSALMGIQVPERM